MWKSNVSLPHELSVGVAVSNLHRWTSIGPPRLIRAEVALRLLALLLLPSASLAQEGATLAGSCAR